MHGPLRFLPVAAQRTWIPACAGMTVLRPRDVAMVMVMVMVMVVTMIMPGHLTCTRSCGTSPSVPHRFYLPAFTSLYMPAPVLSPCH